MKSTTSLITLFSCSFSLVAMAFANSGQDQGSEISVLSTPPAQIATSIQDPVQPPMPADQTAPGYSVVEGQPITLDSGVIYQPVATAPIASECCQPCCRRTCRKCRPAPVPMTFCLVDPCGCSHEACVEVPACCLGEQPSISWRNGVAGRQIATLCWNCCDFKAKVIVTGCGKVRVRD